jgi:hypothetical protein
VQHVESAAGDKRQAMHKIQQAEAGMPKAARQQASHFNHTDACGVLDARSPPALPGCSDHRHLMSPGSQAAGKHETARVRAAESDHVLSEH